MSRDGVHIVHFCPGYIRYIVPATAAGYRPVFSGSRAVDLYGNIRKYKRYSHYSQPLSVAKNIKQDSRYLN